MKCHTMNDGNNEIKVIETGTNTDGFDTVAQKQQTQGTTKLTI